MQGTIKLASKVNLNNLRNVVSLSSMTPHLEIIDQLDIHKQNLSQHRWKSGTAIWSDSDVTAAVDLPVSHHREQVQIRPHSHIISQTTANSYLD
jgi:hypothetical protein